MKEIETKNDMRAAMSIKSDRIERLEGNTIRAAMRVSMGKKLGSCGGLRHIFCRVASGEKENLFLLGDFERRFFFGSVRREWTGKRQGVEAIGVTPPGSVLVRVRLLPAGSYLVVSLWFCGRDTMAS